MARLTVIDAGFLTTIQDLGRLDSRKYGVPHSGAMDLYSAGLANKLLSNPKETGVIEMTLYGGTFIFSEPTQVAITGARCEVIHGSEKHISPCIITINTGDTIKIGAAHYGNFIYLAISGGFRLKSYLDSVSYYLGILDSSLIKKGTHLTYLSTEIIAPNYNIPSYDFKTSLKAYRGPEFQLLNRKQQEQLLSKSFTVSKTWNRMAFQLVEQINNDLKPIKSSPVLPGTVQLTPQGHLIVLMRDAQTTGGYPRILQLNREAINRMSQYRVGEVVDFVIEH